MISTTRPPERRRLCLPFFAALLVACASADAPEPAHILWQISNGQQVVYLLGSVHLLREKDYPLPAAFDEAYARADELVMELDLDDLDPAQIQQTMYRAGMIQTGETLQSLLGDALWHRASNAARAIDFDLTSLNSAEPWFAALTIVEVQMLKLGFNPRYGIESHFARRAFADNKPILGLESVAHQVGLFDSLPAVTQQRFLLKTIEDAADFTENVDVLIDAWKRGDTQTMAQELTQSFDDFPDVYARLVTERNQRWLQTIEELIGKDRNYLIIVGALHLVGDDSVVELLRARGYRVERL